MSNNKSTSLKSYQTVDETNGEVLSIYRYLTGNPREYRFNGQVGKFYLDGNDIGAKLKMQPIAWRFFEENLFARDRKEEWGEVFFIDKDNCVAVVMFNNSSVNNLKKVMQSIFYRGSLQHPKTFADFVVNIASKEKTSEKGKYFIAEFDIEDADPEKVKEYREFALDHHIYREDTLTPTAVYNKSLVSDTFFLPPVPKVERLDEVTETILN